MPHPAAVFRIHPAFPAPEAPETFPAYTDNTILNNVIEWGAYILGWLMICYIVPLVMEIQITSPINDKIEQRIREANSKYN